MKINYGKLKWPPVFWPVAFWCKYEIDSNAGCLAITQSRFYLCSFELIFATSSVCYPSNIESISMLTYAFPLWSRTLPLVYRENFTVYKKKLCKITTESDWLYENSLEWFRINLRSNHKSAQFPPSINIKQTIKKKKITTIAPTKFFCIDAAVAILKITWLTMNGDNIEKRLGNFHTSTLLCLFLFQIIVLHEQMNPYALVIVLSSHSVLYYHVYYKKR